MRFVAGIEKMVVGRTLWDFIIEAVRAPDLRIALLVLIVMIELSLIVLVLMVKSGLIVIRLGDGLIGVELHPVLGWMLIYRFL